MHMKFKKKYLYILLTLGMAVAFLVFTINGRGANKDNDVVNNRLILPTLTGEIEEVFTPGTEIEPGTPKQKDVKITNTGTTPLFVRVMALPKILDPNGTLLPGGIGDEITVNLSSDWQDGGDGYYYYKDIVEPGNSTPSLFTSVTLASGLGEEYDDAEFTIQVKSETITAFRYEYRNAWWDGATPTSPPLSTIDGILESLRIGV